MIAVRKISEPTELEIALDIRKHVFHESQKDGAPEDFDLVSEQFLAYDGGDSPCGTARWRFGQREIFIEQCAVLEGHRDKGIGTMLVQAIIEDIQANPNTNGMAITLHCQPQAIFLYQKFGFTKSGPPFSLNGTIQVPMSFL